MDSVNEAFENSSGETNTLADALHMLVDLHITLLESAKKKQEILVSAEINPLLAIMADESQLKKKVNQADEMRMEVLEHDKSYLPLVKLIEQQPDGKTKDELEAQLQLLVRLFDEILKVNKLNQQLLQQSLTYTKFVIGQILGKAKGSNREEKISEDAKEYARLFE
ncbi:flagellar export chaperone FlgN [Neobacillus niacini]|uniref:flagellar export chaperone FlgN n=1 Tax=Neobacillus niacini TaxID=86668 RepID=UPI00204267B7|nr:flagellar export chaperone FlgN [Neobacillus niacini]